MCWVSLTRQTANKANTIKSNTYAIPRFIGKYVYFPFPTFEKAACQGCIKKKTIDQATKPISS